MKTIVVGDGPGLLVLGKAPKNYTEERARLTAREIVAKRVRQLSLSRLLGAVIEVPKD